MKQSKKENHSLVELLTTRVHTEAITSVEGSQIDFILKGHNQKGLGKIFNFSADLSWFNVI